jgi:prepilin-type processing-associated H-X9-DG protein
MEAQRSNPLPPTPSRIIYCPKQYASTVGWWIGDTWGIPYPGRHNGGSNCAFVDGHAKWLSDSVLLNRTSPCWAKAPPPVGS